MSSLTGQSFPENKPLTGLSLLLPVVLRNLSKVKNPGQLAGVISEVNPVFGLLCSTVICRREGPEGSEYIIYPLKGYQELQPVSISGISLEIIDERSDQIFYDFLENAGHDTFMSALPMDAYPPTQYMHPYLARYYEMGGRQVNAYHLMEEQNLIGFWLTIPDSDFKSMPFSAEQVEPLISQLSATVNNINIYSELAGKKKEMEILNSLNIDLAASRDKTDLLSIIRSRLQNLFAFSHHFVYKVNESDMTLSILLSDAQSPSRFHPLYDAVKSAKFPVANTIYERMIHSAEPLIVNLANLASQGPLPPHLQVNYDSGIEKVVMLALRADSKLQGIWTIAFTGKQPVLARHLKLIQTVAAPISIAVANISANDALKTREEEQERMMVMSLALTAISNKKELADALETYLPGMFDFQSFYMFVDGYSSQEEPFICLSKASARRGSFSHSTELRASATGLVYPDIFDSAAITLTEIGPLVRADNDLKFLNSEYRKGAKTVVSISLRNDNRSIGMMLILLSQDMQFPAYQYNLLKVVSYQIATSISDLLLNDNLRRREFEKELLLSLSEDIAAVRDKKQLTGVIKNRLKPNLGFGHFALGVKGPDNSIVSFLTDPDSRARLHPAYKRVFKQEREQCEDFIDFINRSPHPVILDKTNVGQFKELPYVIHINFESGVKEILIAKLFDGVSIFGYCFFFFDRPGMISKEQFSLIKGIANQLSNSVVNILANERLYQNEKKKGILLSFSKHIATSRNITDLSNIVDRNMKDILGFNDSTVLQFSNGGEQAILITSIINNSFGSENNVGAIPLHEVAGDIPLAQNDPLLLDLKNLSDKQLLPPFLKDRKNGGINYVKLIKLNTRGEEPGYWMLCFEDRPQFSTQNLELMQEVSAIIATTISNISFNDRLNKREQEKTALLEFTEAIAGVEDRFQLRGIFNRYLQNLCFIEDISLHWFSDYMQSQSCYFWNQIAPGAADPKFSGMMDRKTPADDEIFSAIIQSGNQCRFKISELSKINHVPEYVSFLCQQHCEYIVGVPLFRGKEIAGILFVKEFDNYTADQPLFKGLCTQLAIAISNLVSSERVLQQLSQIKMYQERLEEEKVYLKQELETSHHYSEIIGESEQINTVFRMVSQVAGSDSTVLILGETGTGKELIARAIHNNSPRRKNLLVKVNCAALPPNLIQSELFGHEKGAFTGATERRIGKFELANGGSLFLDEIGEMPLELQVKLLRALQEREIERVGGRGTIKVDVRIISATNRNLEQQVAEGRFRSDLYFRLSTFPIHLPALRDRKTDIPLLAMHFLNRFSKKSGKDINNISQKAMQDLLNYNWPGNVRELEHQIERSVIMTDAAIIKAVYLPVIGLNTNHHFPEETTTIKTIDENERELIIRTLRHCKGKVSGRGGAAELLGVPSTTLNAKIKRLGIKKNFSR